MCDAPHLQRRVRGRVKVRVEIVLVVASEFLPSSIADASARTKVTISNDCTSVIAGSGLDCDASVTRHVLRPCSVFGRKDKEDLNLSRTPYVHKGNRTSTVNGRFHIHKDHPRASGSTSASSLTLARQIRACHTMVMVHQLRLIIQRWRRI